MKKIFLLLFSLIFVLSGCSISNSKQPATTVSTSQDYVKSVWITYYELQDFIKDNNEEKFIKSINDAFNKLKDMGFNTVTVQVRPCADAFYKSDYFPVSKYCFDKQGADLVYDPLKIMCSVAKDNDLRIEAWINPYRVSQDNKIDSLSDDNLAKIWYNDKSKKSNVYVSEKQIFFNPASDDVTQLIVNGVVEIVKNYDVYAIHFDDYFYPTADKSIDSKEYKKYTNNGGKLSLAQWRRENISNMIKTVYNAIKGENSDVLFGVSPASDIDNDYSKLYADVETWCTDDGYVDYICPQIYFGFKNEIQPFMFTTKKWTYISNKSLYIGLPLYKCSKKDDYASNDNNKDAINEFVNNANIISRQITYINKIDSIKGFYIFSYSYLQDEACSEEVTNMLKAMQDNNLG